MRRHCSALTPMCLTASLHASPITRDLDQGLGILVKYMSYLMEDHQSGENEVCGTARPPVASPSPPPTRTGLWGEMIQPSPRASEEPPLLH